MPAKLLVTPEERAAGGLSPVHVAADGRYFLTERNQPFLLVAQNDAISWVGLSKLYRRRDVGAVSTYLENLRGHGVTVLRLMLEYCQPPHPRFWEKPVGTPVPAMVRYWDDLFALCERHGIRILLTLWDTFFMSRRWRQHPYNRRNGGPCREPGDFMVTPEAREAQRTRFEYVIQRWGGSPALFGFDLFNEIHPFWGGSHADRAAWITEMAAFVHAKSQQYHNRVFPLTVSIFGACPGGEEADLIYRSAALDFATTHVYGEQAIDVPLNTIDAALAMNRAVRYALEQIRDNRPYTDSESGPIHLFGNLHRTLPVAFDAEYLHNMSWAHLASGGAGGGMRWPCRHPHILPTEMLSIQQSLSRFIDTCDIRWQNYRSRNIDQALQVDVPQRTRTPAPSVIAMGCADDRSSLIWLLQDRRARNSRNKQARTIEQATLTVRDICPGTYHVTFWDTYNGTQTGLINVCCENGILDIPLPSFTRDLALVLYLHTTPDHRLSQNEHYTTSSDSGKAHDGY